MRPILAILLVITLGGCRSRPVVDTGPRVRHWIEALHGPDVKLRKEAAFKLGNLGLTDPVAVVPALTAALADADAAVRREAILALLKCGRSARAAAGALADVKRKDPDATVRDHAGKALKKLILNESG
jgi:HEAT repeat protein